MRKYSIAWCLSTLVTTYKFEKTALNIYNRKYLTRVTKGLYDCFISAADPIDSRILTLNNCGQIEHS